MGWKVFLPDRFIAPVELKIHEIAGSLVDRVPDEGGLVGGKAGLACFYAYYANWSGSKVYEGLVERWIEQALNPSAGQYPDPRFSSGMAGVAWLIHHLSEAKLIAWDADSIFDELDEYLYSYMISEIRTGHFDYLHGASGIALYFLRHSKNEKYRQILAELVSEIEKIAIRESDDSLKWVSPPGDDNAKSSYNLSLSHGMSSIILILARIYKEGISIVNCEQLIREGLRYMEKQKLPAGEYLSVYPSLSLESTEMPGPSRLAWCYGDIGPGLAFHIGGELIAENAYQHHGLDVLLKSCERRDQGENLVYDAGICHGASGLALINNIMYQKTSLTPFRDAALYWLDIVLNMAVHEDGIAGYKAWYHPKYGGWKATEGLLDGAAGIGLALMSFVEDREPNWARALLLI